MIINVANLATLFQAFHAAFKGAFDGANAQFAQVVTMVPSSTESNFYGFMGQFPKMREWLGDRIVKNIVAHSYTVINKDFESTIGVPAPKIKDDQHGVFSLLFAEMGNQAKMHPDQIVFALLLAGAVELGYDGQPFFDQNHPVIVDDVATVGTNYDTVGGGNLWVLMDTTRPLRPLIWQMREDYSFQSFTSMTDESVFNTNKFKYGVSARVNAGFGLWQTAYGSLNTLNAANFDGYVTTMMGRKTDEDQPFGIRPNLLVCGPSRRAAARDLIVLDRLASGAANPNFQEVEILVTPYLL